VLVLRPIFCGTELVQASMDCLASYHERAGAAEPWMAWVCSRWGVPLLSLSLLCWVDIVVLGAAALWGLGWIGLLGCGEKWLRIGA
jgi:hypothetical protein